MPDDDDYFLNEGKRRLLAGSRAYGRAVRISSLGGDDRVEDELREAMHTLRGAMNYLEDEDDEQFEIAHTRLDAAGSLARRQYPDGCHLDYDNGTYYQRCPVALAHNRVGMSVGIKIRAMQCSICHRDPEDCTHIRGRVYDGNTCGHVITQADLLEVSFVGKPAQPDARITAISVRHSELQARLGNAFKPGVPILCDKCLSPCSGIAWPFRGVPTS